MSFGGFAGLTLSPMGSACVIPTVPAIAPAGIPFDPVFVLSNCDEHTLPALGDGELVSGTGSTSPSTTTFTDGGTGLIYNPSTAGSAFGTIYVVWHATSPVATDPPTQGFALQPRTAILWTVSGRVKIAGIVIGGGTTNYYVWSAS